MNTQVNTNYRFFIKTLGCKVNQYESQAMREILIRAEFKECLSKETANIYIINTCTVTHKADHESRYWAGIFHKTNPKANIVITGCCAEKDSESFTFLPGVAYIVKNEDKVRIAEILSNHNSRTTIHEPHRFLTITDFKDRTKAFVKIQDGCENFCAYCKVPYVRGNFRSKALKDIVEEVNTLVSKGFREIVLTGICLGAWGSDIDGQPGLIDVLKKVLDDLSGDFRIRLSSIEPKYVTNELIDYMAQNKRICRHLHIPMQSGDDEILSRMNRPYTVQQLKDLIIKVKNKVQDIGITTDILVGFPGESDKHFWNTVNLIKEILPVRTHIFPFSKRDGTAAHTMDNTLPDNIIKRRLQRLKITAITASYLYRERFLKETLGVLVESKRDKQSGRLTGYSDNYIKIQFNGPDNLMKRIVPVKIEELNLAYTIGSVLFPTASV